MEDGIVTIGRVARTLRSVAFHARRGADPLSVKHAHSARTCVGLNCRDANPRRRVETFFIAPLFYFKEKRENGNAHTPYQL